MAQKMPESREGPEISTLATAAAMKVAVVPVIANVNQPATVLLRERSSTSPAPPTQIKIAARMYCSGVIICAVPFPPERRLLLALVRRPYQAATLSPCP